MTTSEIITIAAAHGVKWQHGPNGIQLWEAASRVLPSGEVVSASSWIDAPTTRRGLFAWLGY